MRRLACSLILVVVLIVVTSGCTPPSALTPVQLEPKFDTFWSSVFVTEMNWVVQGNTSFLVIPWNKGIRRQVLTEEDRDRIVSEAVRIWEEKNPEKLIVSYNVLWSDAGRVPIKIDLYSRLK